jgi:acyl-coenzyme A synthetase/AMP-(fatty) acid ligase
LVGKIIDGVTVETVDDNGNPLPAGVEGELRIRAPSEAITRYLTAEGEADILRDGWFYPGDLGHVGAAGELHFRGRKSTVINHGGRKVNPEVVEAVLQEMPGVQEAAIAPVDNPHGYQSLCALVVADSCVTTKQVNRFLSDKKANVTVEALKHISAVPRRENGKVDRPALRELAASEGLLVESAPDNLPLEHEMS